jgi:hypothetical protein
LNDFKFPDLSIKMKSTIVLTRYLYNKDAVISSLRLAVYERRYEEANFWAYELYFSGFTELPLQILENIYHTTFAKQCPKLGLYIKKKAAEETPAKIATIIKNLTMKNSDAPESANVKFVNVKEHHIDIFKTPQLECPNWKFLQTVCKYSVFSEKLSKIQTEKRLKLFRENWLYYAGGSPIWEERIRESGGVLMKKTQTVEFENDDLYESFYDKYGYEPDEQPLEIQKKCMGII